MAKRPSSRSSSKHSPVVRRCVRLFRLPGLPEIQLGDDLAGQIANAARKARITLENGDILVIAQKIVSKAEGAVVRLATIRPSLQAQAIAERQKKDPRLVEVILKESRRIVRSDQHVIAADDTPQRSRVDRRNTPRLRERQCRCRSFKR